jgi:hypothetical protein
MTRRNETKPRKRTPQHDRLVNSIAVQLLRDANEFDTYPDDVRIFAVNQVSGAYSSRKKWITIPLWAINDAKKKNVEEHDYVTYYIAHELAHAITWVKVGSRVNHGPEFMKEFKNLCPKRLWHHEIGYKPRNAKAAGISHPVKTAPKMDEVSVRLSKEFLAF